MRPDSAISTKKMFYINPERFSIVSSFNNFSKINQLKLKEETEKLINLFSSLKNEMNDFHINFLSSSIDLLNSMIVEDGDESDWICNITYETHESYKTYKYTCDFLEPLGGYDYIIRVLRDYLSLRDTVLSFKAKYFEHDAFSADGFSLKRGSEVYFRVNGKISSGTIYSHYEDHILVSVDGNLMEFDFDEVFYDRSEMEEDNINVG